MSVQRFRDWLLARDADLHATRRAARTAVVMPLVFALAFEVIGNPTMAFFAAFGSFAMLLLADFGGSHGERLAALLSVVAVGCVLITLATLVSQNAWVAAGVMFVVGFVVLFAGVVSSTLVAASTSILLSFILPVTTPAGPAAIPERLLGWLLAGAVALPALVLLWPAPRVDPLRDAAADACLKLSARMRAEVAGPRGDRQGAEAVDETVASATAAVATLRNTFLATPYRPSGLTTAARAVVRLVDEAVWLGVILDNDRPRPGVDATVRAVRDAAAVLLEHAGKTLSLREPPQDSLQDHLDDLARARDAMEEVATNDVVLPHPGAGAEGLLGMRGPSFRAQELSFAVTGIAENVAIVAAADQRTWWQKLLGHRPPGLVGPLTAAQERALAHVEPHSVWLRNSIRGAIGLAGAVLVADLSAVQHSFWIVLGALSVLRSNALSTGQNVVRGLLGTLIGFVIGGALVVVLGTNASLLWVLLPLAILGAGIAPAISFTAGQAGFTVTLLVLFNIITPAGWHVGLVRIEDVAIGCAVSLAVGALFWPRGASGALRIALAEAYAACAAYLRVSGERGVEPDSSAGAAEVAMMRAAAAARRLDDAFREYLAERGNKRLSLAEVASLLTGVAGLRLTADAVCDLWADADTPLVDISRARVEMVVSTERVTTWFAALAQAMVGVGTVPRALPPDGGAATRLIEALGQDLESVRVPEGAVKAQTVRLLWTQDHLDAARRLQNLIEEPARSAVQYPIRVEPALSAGLDSAPEPVRR